jgi:hypothetical protein
MKKTKVNYNFDVKKEIVESFTFEKNYSNHKRIIFVMVTHHESQFMLLSENIDVFTGTKVDI